MAPVAGDSLNISAAKLLNSDGWVNEMARLFKRAKKATCRDDVVKCDVQARILGRIRDERLSREKRVEHEQLIAELKTTQEMLRHQNVGGTTSFGQDLQLPRSDSGADPTH